MGAVFGNPLSFGTIAGGVFRFGDAVYNEQLVSLAFANSIGNTSLGAKVSYIQYRAEGYGTHYAIGVNVGGITQITSKLLIGAWIQNINQPKLSFDNSEKAPVKLIASAGFKPSDKLMIVTEIEKDIIYQPVWKTGIEQTIHKKFLARLGFNLNPQAFFFGVGFYNQKIKIDYSLQSLNRLGAAHQASFSYIFNQTSSAKK